MTPPPVVAEGDDRPGDVQGLGEFCEVAHPLRQRTRGAGALGEAHLELVDRDDPPGGLACGSGIRRGLNEVTPQVRPGGVAVDAEDGADGRGTDLRQPLRVVEHMPAAVHQPRQARVEPGQPDRGQRGWDHQASSIIEVLRPEPTPMRRTRSPRFRFGASCARVIGIDAGPMFPRVG